MDILQRHEAFEMEVLERLNGRRLLDALIFGGGTMLRLCHAMSRYSVDLDFWFLRKVDERGYFERVRGSLGETYTLTDAHMKRNTLLFELRSGRYPRRLKIEIRRGVMVCADERGIAFSTHATAQVALRTHTLGQMMKNKVSAALERREIRDFHDIEFLLRRGIPLAVPQDRRKELLKTLSAFKPRDFKVALGSLLDPEQRRYYAQSGFRFLEETLARPGQD